MLAYYGARDRRRVMRTWRLTMRAGVIMMVLFTAVFLLFPDEILSLFNASADMLRIGRSALTIMPLCLPLAALSISMSVVFQAVGNGFYSMFLSIARQLVVLVPAAWILAKVTNDVTMVWWSFPIAEGVSLFLCIWMFVRTYRDRILQLDLPPLDAERAPQSA